LIDNIKYIVTTVVTTSKSVEVINTKIKT